jgi:hypothetical protein
MSLEDLPHTYSCTWCYYSKKRMETKREALLAEELGAFIPIQIFLGFVLREQDARTNTIFKPK